MKVHRCGSRDTWSGKKCRRRVAGNFAPCTNHGRGPRKPKSNQQKSTELIDAINSDDEGALATLARTYKIPRVSRCSDWELCFSIAELIGKGARSAR